MLYTIWPLLRPNLKIPWSLDSNKSDLLFPLINISFSSWGFTKLFWLPEIHPPPAPCLKSVHNWCLFHHPRLSLQVTFTKRRF